MSTNFCPLERTATKEHPEETSGRYSPPNADAALCYQLHDTVKFCFSLSLTGQRKLFKKQLDVLKAQINAHEQLHP